MVHYSARSRSVSKSSNRRGSKAQSGRRHQSHQRAAKPDAPNGVPEREPDKATDRFSADRLSGSQSSAAKPILNAATSHQTGPMGAGRPVASGGRSNAGPTNRGGYGRGPSGSSPYRGVFSAIDLGTNNCRLLIAKPTRDGFRVIDAFSRIVRLGEGVNQSQVLSEEAMDRTIEALKICSEKVARKNVTCMRHVATEACRAANNTDAFVARVRSETGLNLEVISAAEEARLAVLGCQSLIARDNDHALVFDIGGGSTELIWVQLDPHGPLKMRGWMSIPWGVVNLTERFNPCSAASSGKASDDLYGAMVAEVQQHLDAFEEAYGLRDLVQREKVQFLGTSGTVTTLASLHLQLPRYCRETVDGAWMQASDIEILSRRVAQMSTAERCDQPCIGKDRSDLVVAGCAILEAILSMWPVERLRVADRGIREGILRGLMEDEMPVMALNRHSS